MSKQKKPRNKRYRPRMTYPNPLILNANPDKIEERLNRLEAGISMRFNQIANGTAERQTYLDVFDVFRAFYVHALAFENKSELQGIMVIGGAACCLCAQLQFRENEKIPESALRPIALGIEACVEMMKNATIMELGKVFQLVDHSSKSIIKAHANACWFFSPNDKSEGNRKLLGRTGMTVLHGKLRTGYIRENLDLERMEWFSPLDETTIAIEENILVVLAEPMEK